MVSYLRGSEILKCDADFTAGMNDVLPKPFTKEGLISMLEKHLSHLKKHPGSIDPMAAPPAPLARMNRSIKSEDSPATSPATASNWNSPNNFSGVSPASNQADDGPMYAPNSAGPYSVQPPPRLGPPPMYNTSPGGPMVAPPPQVPPHRRGISDISGGPPEMGDVKRQQLYSPGPGMAPQMQAPMPPRPR